MILFRYFTREVFFTMLAVAGVVLVVAMGTRFSVYLNEAASGLLSRDVLFLTMAYRLPRFLELIVPISFFLSVVLTYGRLHADSEMVILESCGMSPARLAGITLTMALIVMGMTGIITLWVKPWGEAQIETLLADQRNMTEFDAIAPGRFQKLANGRRVTYAEDITPDGEMRGVFMNEYRSKRTRGRATVTVVNAESGTTREEANGDRFLVLENGTRFQGRPGTRDYQAIEYEEYGQLIERGKNRNAETIRTAIPTLQLWQEPSLRNTSELQWRISLILMIPVIALIAVPLSRVNPRQGRFTRLVPSMMLCFTYVVSLSFARSAMEKEQIPAVLGLWWVHALFIAIAAGLYQGNALSRWIDGMRRH